MGIFRPFHVKRAPVLTKLLSSAGFKLVDIGGRGSAFSPFIPLAKFADYYAVEPDAEEAERLRKQIPEEGLWRSVTVIPEAIASKHGHADLYVTRRPGMSSLLEPNRTVTGRYVLDSKFEVVSVVKVPTIPLDEAASRYGFSDAAFIKLDTQGSELEILQSGSQLVGGPLLGIHVETHFHRFYKGQSFFADVDAYLRAQGYELFSLSRTLLRRAKYRESHYSRRVIAWAHCLYLREPEALLATAGDATGDRLSRLLGLALAFKFYDLALEVVDVAARAGAIAAANVEKLREEVSWICTLGTAHVLENLWNQDVADEPTAPTFRDRAHRE